MRKNYLRTSFFLISLLTLSACSTAPEEIEQPNEEDAPIAEPTENDEPKEPEGNGNEGEGNPDDGEGGEQQPTEPTIMEKYKTKTNNSFIADAYYKNGFYLISPESTNQYWEKDLDYNGEAETDFYDNPEAAHTNYWSMAQWWTPFNFKDATYEKVNGVHTYENESRRFEIDTQKGEIVMELDSYLEYQARFNGKRTGNEPWSHFLLQQSFRSGMNRSLGDINPDDNPLYVSLDVTINEATYKGDPATQNSSDCAQFILYLNIYNDVPSGADYDEVGAPCAMWFGIPIYDSRYSIVPQYIGGDVGFQGATGHLIYSLSNNEYFQGGVSVGQKYHLDLDVTEYLQSAFIYGVQNNYLTNCKWQNMILRYMNIGWELPGEFKVKSTYSNLDIYTKPIA